jgi:hypothetical protein
MTVARMTDILCVAILRRTLKVRDISGDFTGLIANADDTSVCTLLPEYCLVSLGYNLPILTV